MIKNKISSAICCIVFLLLATASFAQAPQFFNYQAIVRDLQGEIIPDQDVSFRISLIQNGSIVYTKIYNNKITNQFGLVNLKISSGYGNVDWNIGSVSIKVEIDPDGGTNFIDSGTSELLSVPYAIYAENSNDDDPENEIQDLQMNGDVLLITNNSNPTYLNLSKYLDNTDNQTLSLTGFDLSILNGNSVTLPNEAETDPVFVASPANSITNAGSGLVTTSVERANWNKAVAGIFTAIDNSGSTVLGNASEDMVTITGGLRFIDGAQGSNKILGSDAFGNASWQPAGGNGELLSANNLSDVANAGTSRTNLGIGNVENTALSTWAGSTNITTLGTIATGTIPVANVTGLSKVATSGSYNDLADKPTIAQRGIDDVPVNGEINESITSNWAFDHSNAANPHSISKTSVGLSNVENTALSTWAGSTNITTLGTIGTGAWQGNVIGNAYINWAAPGTIGSTTPNSGAFSTLSTSGATTIGGALKITSGTPGADKVLTSDASGNATWETVSVGDELTDADSDTKIQLEESADEDIIRFDIGGTERWVMNGSRLEALNTGYSTFIGEGAGQSDDLSDNANTFIGYRTGFSNTTGLLNTAVGVQALTNNTTGSDNTANGRAALFSNTTGGYNTANGSYALYKNTTGSINTANGYAALYSNTTGYANTAVGEQALYKNSTGTQNTAFGNQALYNNTTGSINTANGYAALYFNTTGYANTAVGAQALYKNSTGTQNTAFGNQALYNNTISEGNTASGYYSLGSNTEGNANSAYGTLSLKSNTTGGYNTASGYMALYTNTTGNNNTVLGSSAGRLNLTGSGNVFLGYQAGYNETNSNKLYIENSNSISPLIYGEFDNNLARINGNLEVSGTVKIEGGTPGADKVLTSDASGNSTWQTLSMNEITDADTDTKIQLEESADEDIIRFDLGGTERWVMNGSRLEALNTGYSTFIGEGAGQSDDLSDNANTFIGYQSGYSNTTGDNNTANGFKTLYSNTTGIGNTANGNYTLYYNTTGNYNTANGIYALVDNTSGEYNTANGIYALYSNTTGSYNTANGPSALFSNITGSYNTANGCNALYSNTTGYNNTANGYQSLANNTTGNNNTANGYSALYSNTIGYCNTANGETALFSNTTGSNNIANGYQALYSNTIGEKNIAIGVEALFNNLSGIENTVIGVAAGYYSTGSGNVFLGYNAGVSESGSNKLYIENSNSTTPLIYGEFDNDLLRVNGALEVSSTTGALVVPRMNTTQRDALTAVNGSIIYNTTTNQFNFYENSSWVTK
ncbi:beta strand repeat-containing protein [Bacteroidota bacterium]